MTVTGQPHAIPLRRISWIHLSPFQPDGVPKYFLRRRGAWNWVQPLNRKQNTKKWRSRKDRKKNKWREKRKIDLQWLDTGRIKTRLNMGNVLCSAVHKPLSAPYKLKEVANCNYISCFLVCDLVRRFKGVCILREERVRWTGYSARVGMWQLHGFSYWKPETKLPLGGRSRCEEKIEMDLSIIGWEAVDWILLAVGVVQRPIQHEEPWDSLKSGNSSTGWAYCQFQMNENDQLSLI